MVATEEIVVTGENFIERRIYLEPRQSDLAEIGERAYESGYGKGWKRGFVVALVLCGAAAICIWSAVQW